MSYATFSASIRSRIATQLETGESLFVDWENVQKEPPSDTIWIRPRIREGAALQVDFGSNSHRRRTPGVLIFGVFGPADKGDGPVLAVVDTIATKFSAVVVGDVTFQMAYPVRVGINDSGEYQINVNCPFTADDFVEVT